MNDPNLDAQAGEYVLGTLAGEERTAFEARLASDSQLRAQVEAWERRLGPAVVTGAPVPPGPDVWARIQSVLQARQAEDFGGVTVRAEAGVWEPLAPGADIKLLWVDAAARTRSFLLRLQPGARVPSHPHPTPEECYVVSGDMVIGDTVFYPGDYHTALAGIDHPVISSRAGGVVFIRGPLYD